MSLQVAIMLVLSRHPDGRATLAAMNADLAILAGAGPAWNARLKRLAARSPSLDIFTSKLVVRDLAGWQITRAGLAALRDMETARTEIPLPATVHIPDVPLTGAPAKLAVVATARRIEKPRSETRLARITDRRHFRGRS